MLDLVERLALECREVIPPNVAAESSVTESFDPDTDNGVITRPVKVA